MDFEISDLVPAASNVLVPHSVVGYAPTTFGALGSVNLQTEPGKAVTPSLAVRLPAGSIPVQCVVTNNGTALAGTGTVNVGTATTAASSSNILTAAGGTVVNLNKMMAVTLSTQAAGSVGVTDTTNFVTATVATSALTAGDLKVVLSFIGVQDPV